MGVLGGYVVMSAHGFSLGIYLNTIANNMAPHDFLQGLLKAMIFGMLDPTLLQGVHQRSLNHHITARCVDQEGILAHMRQRFCVDEVVILFATGAMQCDEIRSLQEHRQLSAILRR